MESWAQWDLGMHRLRQTLAELLSRLAGDRAD
jgi:hypothetical protein